MTDHSPKRPIRSYVRRQSRGLSSKRQRALEDNWPKYGLNLASSPWDFDKLFRQAGPLVVEIGFGMGDNLLERAQAEPDSRFVGIEVHRPGIAHVLSQIEELALTNIRVIDHDAVEALQYGFNKASIDRLLLYFPDPWPKKKHHKRRLVQTSFVGLLAQRIQSKGMLHMATDWSDYAEQMMSVMAQFPEFVDYANEQPLTKRPYWRTQTKFEKRGEYKGHAIYDLVFERT